MICVTLLLLIHAMYSGGIVCVLCGYYIVACVNLSICLLAKSEYVSFPIGLDMCQFLTQ